MQPSGFFRKRINTVFVDDRNVKKLEPMRQTLLITFRIVGDLCYLSHRETMMLWQRILIRCRLPIVYSQGYNPRPRFSLPLPRSVGLQSDEELLWAEMAGEPSASPESLHQALSSLLPAGCEILALRILEGKVRFRAVQADYLFERSPQCSPAWWKEQMDRCVQEYQSGESVSFLRESPKQKAKAIDLHAYLEYMSGNQNELRISCRIHSAGSVRPDELLKWLRIQPVDLARPPRRTAVRWMEARTSSAKVAGTW